MATFSVVVSICSGVMTIIGLFVFLCRPIRDKVLKTRLREEEQNKKISSLQDLIMGQALNEMTKIYYDAMEKGEIKKYKYDSFFNIYSLYSALGGNHWGEKMAREMMDMRVIGN